MQRFPSTLLQVQHLQWHLTRHSKQQAPHTTSISQNDSVRVQNLVVLLRNTDPAMKCGAARWKRQPEGGFTRLGGSPGGTSLKESALRASGSDVAAASGVYRDAGGYPADDAFRSFSIRLPAYITKMRLEKYLRSKDHV